MNRRCPTGRLSHDSLSLSLVKAISRLSGRWSFTVRFIKDFYACTVHALKELLYASVDWIFGVPVMVSTQHDIIRCRQTYLFIIFTSSALVVRSIDLMMTLFLGVMGELASFKGLKLKTLVKILFAAFGRR